MEDDSAEYNGGLGTKAGGRERGRNGGRTHHMDSRTNGHTTWGDGNWDMGGTEIGTYKLNSKRTDTLTHRGTCSGWPPKK